MISTWFEDIGKAIRLSDYSYYFSELPRNPSDPAAFHYVTCKIQRPDGSYAMAKVTSNKHRTKNELRNRLQKEIRKRY